MRKCYCLALTILLLFCCACNFNQSSNLESEIVTISKQVSPAVIRVNSFFYQKNVLTKGLGSGVIYKREVINDHYKYYLITNRHVIDGAYRHQIYIDDYDLTFEAQLLGCDNKVDIAIMTFETDIVIDVVAFADSDRLEKGSLALAIGNPDGFYGSLTLGVISSPKRYLVDDTDNDGINDYQAEYIQTDAAINPGNSGGGLFNLQGELIGINTLKIVGESIENIGFAIPINIIKILIPYLEKGTIPKRIELGIYIIDIHDLTNEIITIPSDIEYGMYVRKINGNSLSETLGMRAGDIIIAVNDIAIKKSYQLYCELNRMLEKSQKHLSITVIRGDEKMTLRTIV